VSGQLSYAVVTPARNEAANLRRLAAALDRQHVRPGAWVIVDTGSTDETTSVVDELDRSHSWVTTTSLSSSGGVERGGPIVRAFELGLASLKISTDVIVKLDADISFHADYFERLLAEFEADPALGMASGTCHEREGGEWRQRHVTGTTVWGASRAYRRTCLDEVLPLEKRMGWDGVDEFRANARGWKTRTFKDLPFHHHRREGERDGSRSRARMAQGRAARFLGYRPWYLVLRSLWNARREPAALAMIWGYTQAVVARDPRCTDEAARAYLRKQQSLRLVPVRAAEALGRRRQVVA
jgi:glycosyltransferase involved in cell wall biosynthesis